MPSTKQLRKQRTEMHAINPHCEKCGILTVLPEDLPYFLMNGIKHIFEVPDNMATIQHKYDKLHPLRHTQANGERRHFLWCYKCNNEYWQQHEKLRAEINGEKLKAGNENK